MSKFKAGDMVQRIYDPFGPVGKVIEVGGSESNGRPEVRILWPADVWCATGGWSEDELELVELAEWERELLDQANVVTYIKLDETDPFEAAMADMVRTYRKKRRDYTAEGASPWENFDRVEDQTGMPFGSSIETHIATKQARLRALASRGGEPLNESVEASLEDRAVYSTIALARYRYPEGDVK